MNYIRLGSRFININSEQPAETVNMNYTLFDRHANMNSEVRGEIIDLIIDEDDSRLTNMLYGLFDGYLYEELNSIQNPKLQSVISIIKTYPTISA
jgi:hypothetical protein